MSKQKKELVDSLCENIIISKDREDWETAVSACVKDIEQIASLTVLPEIGEIAAEHNLGFYPASLLYHSENEEDETK